MNKLKQPNINDPRHGIKAAVPIVLGYISIGLAAGISGNLAGMSMAEVGLLSLILYAGSAQFVFAQLYSAGALVLVPTIFFLNFRHFLYSAALAPSTIKLPLNTRFVIGAWLTDESFSVAAANIQGEILERGSWLIALNFTAYSGWFIGNILGAAVGEELATIDSLGLDFALPAMYAAILMLLMVNFPRIVPCILAVLVAGTITVGIELIYPISSAPLIASCAAATLASMIFRGSASAGVSATHSSNYKNGKL